MTVPSPQEELRAEIERIMRRHYSPREAMDIDSAADELVPLFAARVAAIEASASLRVLRAEAELAAVEGRVAAERTQAAAQAWDEGAHMGIEFSHGRRSWEQMSTNPYRAGADLPADHIAIFDGPRRIQ